MFSWASLEPIVVVAQTIKEMDDLNIIANQLHTYMKAIFPIGNRTFQHNNVPFQNTKIVLGCFQEHRDEFQLISWPPDSPDLNLIK